MVYPTVTWYCGKCGKAYAAGQAAEDCERNHIVDGVAAAFRARLDEVFKPGKPPAKRT